MLKKKKKERKKFHCGYKHLENVHFLFSSHERDTTTSSSSLFPWKVNSGGAERQNCGP